jgi:hypothetical protein
MVIRETVNETTSAIYETRQALKAARVQFRTALAGGRRTQEAVAAYQVVRFARRRHTNLTMRVAFIVEALRGYA